MSRHYRVIWNNGAETDETADTLIFRNYCLDKSHITDNQMFVRAGGAGVIVAIATRKHESTGVALSPTDVTSAQFD